MWPPGRGRAGRSLTIPSAAAHFLDRVPDYPNLLVMRTLSKSGLAGLAAWHADGTSGLGGGNGQDPVAL